MRHHVLSYKLDCRLKLNTLSVSSSVRSFRSTTRCRRREDEGKTKCCNGCLDEEQITVSFKGRRSPQEQSEAYQERLEKKRQAAHQNTNAKK